jgi:hypothetical protein
MTWLLRQSQRWLIVCYLGLALGERVPSAGFDRGHVVPTARDTGRPLWMVGLGCVVCGGEAPQVEVVREEDGGSAPSLARLKWQQRSR